MCKYFFQHLVGQTDAADPYGVTTAANQAQTDAKTLAATTAQATADAEAKRQATIRAGQGAIDTNFKQFDDPYYTNFEKAYHDAYDPQIDIQYNRAGGKAAAALANRGVLDSSIAGNTFGDLAETAANARGKIASDAADAVTGLKGKVNAAKDSLYALNTGAEDPTQLGNQAAASTTSLLPQQSLSPLGNIFSGVLDPLSTAAKANTYSGSPLSLPSFKVAPSGGSSSIVG